MSEKRYLYIQSDAFGSNDAFATWLRTELEAKGLSPSDPIDEDFMQVISAKVDGADVDFHAGKTEEPTEPPTWLVWPEVRASLWARIFRRVDYSPEQSARDVLDEITVSGSFAKVEWDDA